MRIFIDLQGETEKMVATQASELKALCKALHIVIVKEGKLHYPGEFVLETSGHTFRAAHQINAIVAYCVIQEFPCRMLDDE